MSTTIKQPIVNVKDIHGHDYGTKKVISCTWDNNNNLWMILIDFMNSQNSNDYLPCYDYDNNNVFTSVNGNLIATII